MSTPSVGIFWSVPDATRSMLSRSISRLSPRQLSGRPMAAGKGRSTRPSICCILSAMSMQQRPLTQKQETFVRKVAEGMAASRAYREAGYTATAHAAEVMASKTLRNAEVAARLAELRAEQAKRHEVTIDSLAREFDENRAHALRVDQVAAAVQATAMKAKLFGFMVDRQQVQVEHTLRKPSADENAQPR
jgi:phage terminase small subunit